MEIYETDPLKAQYLDFHYGEKVYYGVPNFPKKCAEICLKICQENNNPMKKALDLGCSVGRSTFEFAKGGFEEVIGVDLSANFIAVADELKEKKSLKYNLVEEGDLLETRELNLQTLGFEDVKNKVRFVHASASELDFAEYNSFDLVFGGNLLCRMRTPKDFLKNVHNLLNSNGILIFTSPCTWLCEYTDKNEWVGGFEKDGKRITTYDGIKDILKEQFVEIQDPEEVEFVIRETKRKFQHSFAQATFWKKK